MCGLVGLHLKNAELHHRLGEMITTMLIAMSERGPDSSGIALYEDGVTNGASSPMEIFKDVGTPAEICARYGIPGRSGYQAIGHTRMATESAVTTAHSHPFVAGDDVCLVHNGSFSNYATIRRQLAYKGIAFETDNDSEVAARFIADGMSRGVGLADSIRAMMDALDGFYTLLVGSRDEFAVVRDAFACKPAVVAETDGYVAMASEYRALADLPGIEDADVFEPMPEEVYVWSR